MNEKGHSPSPFSCSDYSALFPISRFCPINLTASPYIPSLSASAVRSRCTFRRAFIAACPSSAVWARCAIFMAATVLWQISSKDAPCSGGRRGGSFFFSPFREEKRKDGTLYNYYLNGTQANSQIGFYNQFTKDHYVVYITEGEKKSLVANYVLGHPVICVPRVNSFGKVFEADESGISVIDHAIELGAKVFVIAYDADKSINAKVLQCEDALVERLKEKGLQIALADWNIGFGKGLDDILGIGIRPNLNMVTV